MHVDKGMADEPTPVEQHCAVAGDERIVGAEVTVLQTHRHTCPCSPLARVSEPTGSPATARLSHHPRPEGRARPWSRRFGSPPSRPCA